MSPEGWGECVHGGKEDAEGGGERSGGAGDSWRGEAMVSAGEVGEGEGEGEGVVCC